MAAILFLAGLLSSFSGCPFVTGPCRIPHDAAVRNDGVARQPVAARRRIPHDTAVRNDGGGGISGGNKGQYGTPSKDAPVNGGRRIPHDAAVRKDGGARQPVAAARRIPHDTAVRNDGAAKLYSRSKSTSVKSGKDPLAAGFANPPPSARPHTWWHWCNGNISKEGITADLEAMKKAGIGGAQIFNVDVDIPPGPVPFMTDKWRECIAHAAKEADRLGIELCIHNCAGWSSSGGPWIKPEYAMQILAWSETGVKGPVHFSEVLPKPQPIQVYGKVDYYKDVAVFAFRRPPRTLNEPELKQRFAQMAGKTAVNRQDGIRPDVSATPAGTAISKSDILDISDRMGPSGRLTWDAPTGNWMILRIGHIPTGKDNHPAPPEGRGLECDKLSREAMDQHWAGMMATVLKDIGPLAGKSINNSLIDSYEVGSQNWTPKFREDFRTRRGYDMWPFLPVITGRIVGSREESERFLWDFRRTIADLYADNYFGYFAELCHKHGLKFSVEPYGNGLFDNLQAGGLADIVMGEFWTGGGAAIETTKVASSAAHTHGRRIVGAESFTSDWNNGRWLVEPYGIKALGDLVFCNGVNRYIFHRYAHQPWMNLRPGLTMGPWGMHLERTVTWWNQASAWLKYVARCQYLLQSGRFAADICYFYGEDGPNDLAYRNGLNPPPPPGYDYDGCDATAVLERMSVKDGRIVLPDGVSYRVLVLPDSPFMTPKMLRRIRDLVRDGATVWGPKPQKSPSLSGYPNCDNEVRQLADEVWEDCDGTTAKSHNFGRGRVVYGETLATLLAQMYVGPDFKDVSLIKGTRLAYIHRVVDGADVYFVSNQRYRSEKVECLFRVYGKTPELWHPDTGDMENAAVYDDQRGGTKVSLRLDPAGSAFVVFRKPAKVAHVSSVRRFGSLEPPPAATKIDILRASYEPADGRPGADVTAKVRELVESGEVSIAATNSNFGDPALNIVKRLRIEYTLDGKAMTKTAPENQNVELGPVGEEVAKPDFEVRSGPEGYQLIPWKAGDYKLELADRNQKTIRVSNDASVVPVAGSWKLRFPSGWGAPESVRLDKLISWSDHPDTGVKYFSGTAEYTNELFVPAGVLAPGKIVMLDLGRVKNFAEVKLNGKDLGVLWKAPFQMDVSGILKPGRNNLAVKVTNLWPNRLIGDEQFPAEVEWQDGHIKSWPQWLVEGKPRPKSDRFTFTTWHFYDKSSPLLESGLIGPVVVRSAQRIDIKP